MNINRDYLIINDVKKSSITLNNGSMFFYITDKNTQNIFVNLVINVSDNELIQKYANIENAEDYTLTMNIVKPDNDCKIIEGKLHDKEKAIFEFDLKEDCVDKIGTYKCELLTKCNINGHEEITTSNSLTYKVNSSILNDLDDIVEAPKYPIVIQLLDKLSDIEQYEEDRRANELARQLAEEQRQTRFNALDADMTDSIQAMDNKVEDIENRITTKEQAVDKLIIDTKKDIDEYKVAKDQEIDEYKAAKDTEINNAITAQDNKIDEAIANQNNRIAVVENNDVAQDNRLDVLENKNQQQDNKLDVVEAKNVEQDNRLDDIEAIDVAQNNRLDAIEAKNQQQDDRLLDIEKVNNRQDIDIKCLYGASQTIDVTKEGNSIYLQNSNNGFTIVDEIKGNTLVNCNKEPDKELILNGNINTSGDNTVTITEGIDGGLVDVALEGNTMVNVCDQKDPIAITKSYTVETGNHVALQGEYDGKCRPVVTGNTLWIDNDTEEVLTAFDDTKNLRLQSSFEDKVVTQEMVDAGEELAENLGKYKVEYKVTDKNKLNPNYLSRDILDSHTVAGVQITYNTDGTITLNGTCTENTWLFGNVNIAKYLTNGKAYRISGLNMAITNKDGSIKYNEFVMSENVQKVETYLQMLTGDEFNNTVIKPMLIEGAEATSYEPYKEYKKTFYLNSPLLEGDTIEQQGDNVVHVHRYWKYTFTGTESWKYEPTYSNDTVYGCYFLNNNGYTPKMATNTGSISDILPSIVINSLVDFYLEGTACNGVTISLRINKSKLSTEDVAGFKQWLQQNPTTVVYKLATPQHEVISQNDTILCDSYVNGHLDMDSVVPIKKVKFISKGLNLKYLYPSAKYNIQFESDNIGKIDFLKLGSWNERLIQNVDITKGVNKLTVTTEAFDSSNNSIYWEGIGFNASNIVVTEATDQDFGYFEGMKSVGECEDLEVKSGNKNILSPIQNPKYPYFIPKGTKLTLSTKDGVPSKGGNVMLYDINGGIQWFSIDSGKSTNTITTKKDIYYIQNQLTITDTIEFQVEIGEVATSYVPYTINTQQLAHEPLRAVGDVKDKYVLIDGKWYIERNCVEKILDGSEDEKWETGYDPNDKLNHFKTFTVTRDSIQSTNMPLKCDKVNVTTHQVLDEGSGYGINLSYYLRINLVNCDAKNSATVDDLKQYLQQNPVTVVYQLSTPVYEPIDYNPFTVYSDVTHISNNSTIPANMIIKNTGYNCLLKPSTTYTVSSNLGLNTVTTPSTLTEDCLRFMDTDTSDVTTMRDVLVLEGDYTTGKPIPSHFSGIESAFEQEYNEAIGKYKVRARIQNEDASKENYIEFYINEPLRGIGDVKDKVYIKNDKVVVERNCGQREYQDGDFGTYLTDKVNTVYQLAEPTYEEVEYNDVKLFIESFKNSTLFYNSNVPVTSTVHYSYSVPIVDTVAKTADVTDQQDQLIIDLATQCAVMEMMLM